MAQKIVHHLYKVRRAFFVSVPIQYLRWALFVEKRSAFLMMFFASVNFLSKPTGMSNGAIGRLTLESPP